MRSTIRFSKPSRASFENGRLLGSAQTRNSRAEAAPAARARIMASAAALPQPLARSLRDSASPRKRGEARSRKAEHIEGSSFRGGVLEVAHGVDEAEGRGAV